LPSRRPSPSRRAVHHRQFTIALPIAAHRRCARGQSPPRSRCPLPWRSRCAPSLAVEELLRRPSPSMSRRTVPCRRGAIAPSLTIEEPSCRPLPWLRSRRAVPRHLASHFFCPPSLSSGWLSRCLSSRLRFPSASALHCGHCLLRLLSVRLVVASPRFSRRHLPSAGAFTSHCAVASCHAHLRPLVRLVKASPLLTAKLPNTDSRVGSSHSLALAISDGEYLNSLPRGKFFQRGFQVSQTILGSHK
jgi:hypothetical protein